MSSWLCWLCSRWSYGEEERIGVRSLSFILREVIGVCKGVLGCWGGDLGDWGYIILVP